MYFSEGNIHKGRPIFGLDGWSGKNGQNGTRQVGWLVKKGHPIFQPIVEETNLSNVPALKLLQNFDCNSYSFDYAFG